MNKNAYKRKTQNGDNKNKKKNSNRMKIETQHILPNFPTRAINS